ncbi:MAG TPA: hypothetical protein VLD57_01465 [Blastocatellia bacterium]|nr:hypothetical protein [Blastocatellia bacterium]
MKRAVFIFSLVFTGLAAGSAAFSQSAGSDAEKGCPFNIAGLWRMVGTTEMTRMFFDFSPEGHITLMGHSPGALPQDFEMLGSVRYKLDKPRAPKRIEFTASRGNDAFAPGVTMLDVIEYSDNSFTTREPASGRQTQWVREQTNRYFLTLAARTLPPPQGGPAFAVLTVMDGRHNKNEAIGVHLIENDAGKTTPVFEKIPAEVYDGIREESEKEKKNNKEENIVLRFELTRSEFEAIHNEYETWNKYLKDRALPHVDPYLNAMEFLKRVAEGLDECGENTDLFRPEQAERDEIASLFDPPRRPTEYIKIMRKKNAQLHVSDAVFPWQWRPIIKAPDQ